MKQRNIAAVLFLTLFTFGIYGIVWFVKTKNEMNKQGAKIPTAWLLIVPFVNLWWMWKYSEGVEKITGEKLSTVMSFVLLFLLGVIGMMIIQYEFNKGGAAAPATPEATPATASPDLPPAPQPEIPTTSPPTPTPPTPEPPTPPPVSASPLPTPETPPTPPANTPPTAPTV